MGFGQEWSFNVRILIKRNEAFILLLQCDSNINNQGLLLKYHNSLSQQNEVIKEKMYSIYGFQIKKFPQNITTRTLSLISLTLFI